MALFPDFIVLKNSTDSDATIEAEIQQGGTDPIKAGEIVIGRRTGGVTLFTPDSEGNIVKIGQGVSSIVSDWEPSTAPSARYWRIKNFTGIDSTGNTSFNIDDIHFFSEDTQPIEGVALGSTGNLTFSVNAGIVPTATPSTAIGNLSNITDQVESRYRPQSSDVLDSEYFIKWDLGQETSASYVNIAARALDNWLTGFDVEISRDDVNWLNLGPSHWDRDDFDNVAGGVRFGAYRPTDNLRALNNGQPLQDGDLWYNPVTEEFHVYYNSAWVLINLVTEQAGGGEGSVIGDGGNFNDGTVEVGFAMGVYGGGDFNAGSATTELVTPFAHAYIDSNNVSSVTAHSGISSAAHVYTASVESYIDFTFDTTQPNTNYSVLHSGESSFNDMEVENKTTTGFRISFYDDATGNPLSSGAVGIGAPVITVYESDPTVGVFTTDGVDLPVELLNTDDGPDGGSF